MSAHPTAAAEPTAEPAAASAAKTPAASEHCDVLIMGGGLAGLTLALQLRRRWPQLQVLVIERRSHPVPEAAHKVGESTVELAAHYFCEVLGLREHLEARQIRKFGFRFFFSEGRRDIDQVTELGASRALPTISYQIDRGIFENFLATHAQAQGVQFVDGARVTTLALAEGDEPHHVQWLHHGEPRSTRARWVVDACGRAGLIKPRLGLAQPNDHACHAVWFRLQHRIAIDEWSDDPAWRARCTPPERWRSTNHLVGAGYWVWLIPLSSGSHSVGIVADPRHHALESMNSFDKAMDWLRTWQPRLYDELDPHRDTLQDFAFFRRFSYGCKQVFSGQRWALTGEAGLFLDPFYSPGSDFIAMANTFITELIARDRAGQPLAAHAGLYDQVFHSFYDSTMALYQDQYALFGDPQVLPVKVVWDYTYYWGILCQLMVHQRLADLRTLSALREDLGLCQRLNLEVQALLRRWGQVSERANPAQLLDQAALPWFSELNASLRVDTPLDDAAFRARLQAHTRLLLELAEEIEARAHSQAPSVDRAALQALIASARERLGPAPAVPVSRLFPGLPPGLPTERPPEPAA